MTPKKILIIQLRRIGDVIFTLPVIGVLRRAFPEAEIDFLVEPPADALVRTNPYLNETLVYQKKDAWKWIVEIRKRKYDWVLDFLSNGRTLVLTLLSGAKIRGALHGHWIRNLAYNDTVLTTNQKYIVEQKLDLLRDLGIKVDGWSWDLKIPESYSRGAEEFLRGAGVNEHPLIGFAPATRRSTRAWIPERFAELASRLAANSCFVLFFWGPGEKEFVRGLAEKARSQLEPELQERVILLQETSLLQLAGLITQCALVVGVDNGPRNMAVALGIPTVAIFGPTNPYSINPTQDANHIAIWDEKLFCIRCGLNRCPYQHECMEHIFVERVLKEIEALLNRKGKLVSYEK